VSDDSKHSSELESGWQPEHWQPQGSYVKRMLIGLIIYINSEKDQQTYVRMLNIAHKSNNQNPGRVWQRLSLSKSEVALTALSITNTLRSEKQWVSESIVKQTSRLYDEEN
jgi:hypothetical protein